MIPYEPLRVRLDLWAFFLLVMALIGCSPLEPIPHDTIQTRIHDVPFYPENRNWCGPASLAGVMNFYDSGAPGPTPIAKATYSSSADGTLMADLAWYAREQGFRVEVVPSEYSELRDHIDRETPIIVFVSRSGWFRNYNHFMVVVGYTSNGLIVNSGLQREHLISRETFRSLWKRNGQYILRLTP